MFVPAVGLISEKDVPEVLRGKPFKIVLPLKASLNNPAKKVAVLQATKNPEGVWVIKHRVRPIKPEDSDFLPEVWLDPSREDETYISGAEAKDFANYLHGMRGEMVRGEDPPTVDWFEIRPEENPLREVLSSALSMLVEGPEALNSWRLAGEEAIKILASALQGSNPEKLSPPGA
jgi:hypothetical protein